MHRARHTRESTRRGRDGKGRDWERNSKSNKFRGDNQRTKSMKDSVCDVWERPAKSDKFRGDNQRTKSMKDSVCDVWERPPKSDKFCGDNQKVKSMRDAPQYESTSIISLFETASQSVPSASSSSITSSKTTNLNQTPDLVHNDVCITECGGVQVSHETVQQYSEQSIMSLFEMEESAYSLTDMAHSLRNEPNILPLSSFLHQQTHGYAHAKPESAPIVLRAVEEMNQCSSLKDPRAHRRSLSQLAHQINKENQSEVMPMPLLFPHFLLKGLVKGWDDTPFWLEKAMNLFQETVSAYEKTANSNCERKTGKKVTLATYLTTKEALGQIKKVKSLVDLSRGESGPETQKFNKFVLAALKSQIPGWQKDANYHATVSDCHFLLQILEKEAIGQVMVKQAIDEMLRERMVSTNKLQQHCLIKKENENAKVFRKLSYQDAFRMNFETTLKEKTSGFVTRISKGFTAENYMWPYSSVFTSPVLRLPADWKQMDFPILLHHAVLRSYAIQRHKKSAIRYATGVSKITKEGHFAIRSTNKESFLLLEENSFQDAEKKDGDLWNSRSRCSIMRYTEQEYSKLLGDIAEGEIKYVLHPIASRQDIRARIKNFREMCGKNRDAIRQKLKFEGHPDERQEYHDSPKNTTHERKTKDVNNPYMYSSEDEVADDYHGKIGRNYASITDNPSLLGIHSKILTKHAELHPGTFERFLKPTVTENKLVGQPIEKMAEEIDPEETLSVEKDMVIDEEIVEY